MFELFLFLLAYTVFFGNRQVGIPHFVCLFVVFVFIRNNGCIPKAQMSIMYTTNDSFRVFGRNFIFCIRKRIQIKGLLKICILIFQPHILLQIAQGETLDFTTGFKALMTSVFGSTSLSTGQPEIDALVATRGMRGMMDTIWLIICAMCFGGVMSASGMIRSITDVFVRFVRKPKSAVCSTVASGLFFNTCTADQYLSIILTGNLFKELYKNRGLESRLLSRTVEDSVTVTSVLIPWNSCGMTQATVLGVSTLTYLPYCFFNLLSPLMSMIIAFTGFKIKQTFSSELSGNNSKPIKQAA